jgi:hypothetical protein
VLDLHVEMKAATYAYFVVNLLMLPSPHLCPWEDEYNQHIVDIATTHRGCGRGGRFFQEPPNRGESARGDVSKAHVGKSVGDNSQGYPPNAPYVGNYAL